MKSVWGSMEQKVAKLMGQLAMFVWRSSLADAPSVIRLLANARAKTATSRAVPDSAA